ncbi:MAG: dockerin type I repeat-containing protein [Clostridia bacterium]|nr:dockerin type I repeat-containing protein [Clostridia bacterium]
MAKKIICLLLTAVITVSGAVCAEAMKAPVTEITLENILAVLDEYDPEDAFIIRNTASVHDPCAWWGGSQRFLDQIDTCVHEQCHSLSHSKASSWNSEYIYLGNGQGIEVNYTETFNTVIAAPAVPEEYRTFRYDTYVGSPSPNLSSNVKGVYGLLNEFTAYHRGICVSTALFNYCYDVGAGVSDWFKIISSAANDRLAFAEFNYYILFYLNYAKEHCPNVYNGIMGNSSFVKAYKSVYESFVSKIALFERLLKNIADKQADDFHRFDPEGDSFFIGNSGTGIFTSDYKKMLGAAETFSDISEKLLGYIPSSAPKAPDNPGGATTNQLGDVDGDGKVSSADARLALRASVQLESYPVNSAQFRAADVDKNGTIEPSDARSILRASVGLEQLNDSPAVQNKGSLNILPDSITLSKGGIAFVPIEADFPDGYDTLSYACSSDDFGARWCGEMSRSDGDPYIVLCVTALNSTGNGNIRVQLEGLPDVCDDVAIIIKENAQTDIGGFEGIPDLGTRWRVSPDDVKIDDQNSIFMLVYRAANIMAKTGLQTNQAVLDDVVPVIAEKGFTYQRTVTEDNPNGEGFADFHYFYNEELHCELCFAYYMLNNVVYEFFMTCQF